MIVELEKDKRLSYHSQKQRRLYEPKYALAGASYKQGMLLGGITPLDWASIGHNFNDVSVVRLLLEHGAVINVQCQNGWTPLHTASGHGALEVVRLLLELGADVEAKNNDGKTALQYAADNGYDEVVEFLREHGTK